MIHVTRLDAGRTMITYIGKGCGFWADEEQRMDWPRIFSSGHVLGPNLRIFIYMCVSMILRVRIQERYRFVRAELKRLFF